MPFIELQILRFIDDSQPGFVECSLLDATGEEHFFVEKVPVVSTEALDAHSVYPCSGSVQCEMIEGFEDAAGRRLLRIDTARPWGVESDKGLSIFTMFATQVFFD